MKLRHYAIKGINNFKEKQEISFDDLPEGLIAITGRNGEGKTTLVEGMFAAIFREMPTRGSNLYRYCSAPDASVSLRFDMHGHTYETEVLLDGQRESQSAYFSADGVPLVKSGKVREFDSAIAEVVGTPSLFLSSVFSSQDRGGSLLTLKVAECKSLFMEMLGLGKHPVIEKRAKDNATSSVVAMTNKSASGAIMRSDYDRLPAFMSIRHALIGERESVIVPEIRDAEARVADARTMQGHYAAEIARLADLAERLADLDGRSNRLKLQRVGHEASQREHESKVLGDVETQAVVIERCSITIEKAEREMEDIRKLILRRGEIEDGVSRRVALHERSGVLADELMEATAAESARNASVKEGLAMRFRKEAVSTAIESCQLDVSELENVPCGGKPPYDRCSKIVRSVESRENLPKLRSTLRQLERETRPVYATVYPATRSVQEIQAEQAQVRIAYIETSGCIPLKTRLDEADGRLNEFMARIGDLDQQRREAQARIVVLKASVDEMQHAYRIRLTEIATEQESIAASQSACLRDAEALQSLQSLLADSDADVAKLEMALSDARKSFARNEAQADAATQRIAELSALESPIAAIESEIAELDIAASDWQLLAKAFSKDGITALEIDAAGPAISALANDLLSACFSTRFAVSIATQRESADASRLIEDFDVRVMDTVMGRQLTIKDLSGGQKVIVGEALSIAIALYNKGSHRLETLFRDETTGSLDDETAPLYVDMLRRAMRLGHFSRVLFITHSSTCAALADARIRCAGGKIHVEG